jgi:hypothetical protein
MTGYVVELRGFKFRQIVAGMTPKEAGDQYHQYVQLAINPDTGCYDPECELDQFRVDHALETGELKSRSWARKLRRRLHAESDARYQGKTDQEIAEIYAATFALKH